MVDPGTFGAVGGPHLGGGEGIGGHEVEDGRQCGWRGIGPALRRGGQQEGQCVFYGGGKFRRGCCGGGQYGEGDEEQGAQQAGGEGEEHYGLETVKGP